VGVLAGKSALVTGGGRGIGRAISNTLADAGAAVVVAFAADEPAALAVARGICDRGGRARPVRMDVRDRSEVSRAVAGMVADLGGIDILVNNAGISRPADFDAISDAEWDEVLGVNLHGAFTCAQVVCPAMRTRGGGSIINIGSVSGQIGGPRTAHYASSKAGLISLGQVIARFGAPFGIRCNTVAPGYIESDMAAEATQAPTVKRMLENIPLGRLGTAQEVANVVLFLASDASSYITAQTIGVNGGLHF
jgi:NAD(P)-dependent dehydrogenase (short-subunit alcohol dehydrogenase family)